MKDNWGWSILCIVLVVVCVGLIVGLVYMAGAKDSEIAELHEELNKYKEVAPDIHIIKKLHPRSHLVMIDYCSEVTYTYHSDSDRWMGHGFDNGRCIVDVIEHGLNAGYPISKLCPKIMDSDSSVPVVRDLGP